MKALLLAAGIGSRLRPLTDVVPKCLVPVGGRPLLDYWLEGLTRVGIGPVLVNVHHLASRVEEYVAQSRFRAQVTLVHEPRLLGTAGTLVANKEFFDGTPVFLAHADNFCLCDLGAFASAHRRRSADTVMTMMTFVTSTPQSCGIVELDDRGVVTAFHEKVADPPGTLANGAVYILEPPVLDFAAGLQRSVLDFSTEVLPHFVGRIQTWHNDGIHYDIGTLDSLAAAERTFRSTVNRTAVR